MSNLLSIKQFSELTGTSESALRYYDTSGVFSPITRERNNYRYYSPEQMIVINFINVLSGAGVSLSEIKKLNIARSPEQIHDLLVLQSERLEKDLKRLQASFAIIDTLKTNISRGLRAETDKITIISREDTFVSMGELNNWSDHKHFHTPLADFVRDMIDAGANVNFPAGGYFESFETYANSPKAQRFFLLDDNGSHKIEAGDYLTAYSVGYYGSFGDTSDRIRDYIEKNNISLTNPVYIVYLLDEVSVKDRDNYLAEIITKV
jgi:DNA-binding transcriptional MerR regulator